MLFRLRNCLFDLRGPAATLAEGMRCPMAAIVSRCARCPTSCTGSIAAGLRSASLRGLAIVKQQGLRLRSGRLSKQRLARLYGGHQARVQLPTRIVLYRPVGGENLGMRHVRAEENRAQLSRLEPRWAPRPACCDQF